MEARSDGFESMDARFLMDPSRLKKLGGGLTVRMGVFRRKRNRGGEGMILEFYA